MPGKSNKLSQFWQELVRRRVVHFLIAYVAACFAIIEFFQITSDTFSISGNLLKLLFILAAIGLPVVIVLPWYINRRKPDKGSDESTGQEADSSEEGKTVKHNLPSQITTFIGREKEMQTTKDMISGHRLVTLTGAGGCGKTRLACEVAIQLVSDFEDGVWFVDLAPISNEDLVTKEISEALKITEVPNQPFIDTLIDKIKDQNLLIILDNCEHLIKSCAEVAGKLMQLASKIKILATSRESLNITGEKVWRVPSLTLLDPKTIIDVESARSSEAVMLFADRAQLKNPEFELEAENVNDVVTICNKLDGIPLALELVASRSRHMNATLILERFADRFDMLSSSDPGISKRQITLQATIEWSYNLLSESEKKLFVRLAVFSKGFDIEAAEEVCSDDQLSRESVLDVLSRLVDRSLVHTVKGIDQSTRYNILETLRQYAQQMLRANKEEKDIRSRHLKYYLNIAEVAYEEQFDSQLNWLNRLEMEHDNMLAALDWAEKNTLKEFIRLSGTLSWFWRMRAHVMLGESYLEKAISIAGSKNESYARILFGLAIMLIITGKDIKRVLSLMNESLNIFRKHTNLRDEAWVLSEISDPYHRNGEYETSLSISEQSLEIAKKVGNPGLVNHCLIYLCQRFVHSKQFNRAKPYVDELLKSSEELDYVYGIEAARHYLGDCTLGTKNYKEAEKRYAHGIETTLKYNYISLAAADLQGVAFALSGLSRWPKSLRLNAAANEKFGSMGISIYGLSPFWDDFIDTYITVAKKEVGKELALKYEEEGIAMGFEKAVEYAMDFDKD